jgi:thiol-disulfide isomerase/thioredoxin
MTTRWIVAAVTSVGAGVLAVPMILGSDPPVYMDMPPLAASHEQTATCKADRTVNFDLTVKDMQGASVRLGDFKGKAILLNYWATWCGPCKAEIPIFNELYAQYKDKGFVVLGISSDDDAPTLREFVKKTPMTYPVLLAEEREDVLDAAGPIYGYPTSFFIDRSGAVCGRHVGLGTKQSFETAIKPLL